MKDLLKSDPKTNSQRDRMLAFYSGQDVVLTAEEEKLKTRLNFVREKLWDWSLSTQEIIEEVCDTFTISKYRAERDIADANYIFGKTLVIDKTLVAGQIVEDIKQTIALVKSARKFDLLPKLYAELTRANAMLPNDNGGTVKTKKIVIFSLLGGTGINAPVAPSDALQQARNLYKRDFEDIGHEEVENG